MRYEAIGRTIARQDGDDYYKDLGWANNHAEAVAIVADLEALRVKVDDLRAYAAIADARAGKAERERDALDGEADVIAAQWRERAERAEAARDARCAHDPNCGGCES